MHQHIQGARLKSRRQSSWSVAWAPVQDVTQYGLPAWTASFGSLYCLITFLPLTICIKITPTLWISRPRVYDRTDSITSLDNLQSSQWKSSDTQSSYHSPRCRGHRLLVHDGHRGTKRIGLMVVLESCVIANFTYPDHLGVCPILSGSKINARNVKTLNL